MNNLTDQIRDGDFLNPRYDKKPLFKKKRKSLQLCAQVAEALNLTLAGCADDMLRTSYVEGVGYNGDFLIVTVGSNVSDETMASERLQHFQKAKGMLRSAVAAAISRKKTPDLRFQHLA